MFNFSHRWILHGQLVGIGISHVHCQVNLVIIWYLFHLTAPQLPFGLCPSGPGTPTALVPYSKLPLLNLRHGKTPQTRLAPPKQSPWAKLSHPIVSRPFFPSCRAVANWSDVQPFGTRWFAALEMTELLWDGRCSLLSCLRRIRASRRRAPALWRWDPHRGWDHRIFWYL